VRVPKEPAERWKFFEDVLQKCMASRGERRRNYQSLRNYYMYGTDGSAQYPAKYNKIYPHIDQLTSFLYSQETTRFSTQLGVSVSDMEYGKVAPINRGINDEWNNSNSDLIFGNGLSWSLVYGSMFVKPRWKVKGIEPFLVEPHNFGVLREDSPGLVTQEAFCHSYYMTKHQLVNELKEAKHPRVGEVESQIILGPKQNAAQVSPLDRIITSSTGSGLTGNVIGNVDFNLTLTSRYSPKVAEELVEMYELYIYDDEISDYRVITMADPYVLIYDRSLDSMFLKNEPPFVQICPLPSYDYFFGFSEVERLIPIQELLNQRWMDVMHLLAKQARPPMAFSGFAGLTDEIMAAFDTPDGMVQTEMPGARAEPVLPAIPSDLWKDIDYLNSMFEDTSGINNVMQGKGEAGVRSTGHASQLARLGSSRVKKRAMIVEDSLEKLATMYLQIKQKYDTRRYKEEQISEKFGPPVEFIAAQFTNDYVVKVDGHSNSPIFVEDQTQIAFELFKVGAITKERLIELTNVPMKPQLMQDLQYKIEPAEAKHAQQEHDLKVAELDARRKSHGKV
jgi:hypothetical protein